MVCRAIVEFSCTFLFHLFLSERHLIRLQQVFSKTLCLLARHPEYIQPLREEAEKVISENGWTMGAATKLRKIDSFIKEAIRFEGGVTSMYFPHVYYLPHSVSSWSLTKGTHGCHPF